MIEKKLYQVLASKLDAIENCKRLGNGEWENRHTDDIAQLVADYMPTGSGFDNGTDIDWQKSSVDKLVFTTSFHHMDENGFYCGWSDHTVTVKPSLAFGYRLSISGRNVNDIKEYMYETFSFILDNIITE